MLERLLTKFEDRLKNAEFLSTDNTNTELETEFIEGRILELESCISSVKLAIKNQQRRNSK